MRLICPNCDAQYEVPANVMPLQGRDVQCSNCGQTWFQEHPDHESSDTDAGDDPLEDEELIKTPEAQEEGPEASAAPEQQEPSDDPEPKDASLSAAAVALDETVSAEDEPIPNGSTPSERRKLNPAVANVLRAEAELEAEARKRELETVESQPDLGLMEAPDAADKRARETRERMARMRGEHEYEDPEPEDTYESSASSRRDLLPDIEEINSTLRSNNDRSPVTDPGQTAQFEQREKRSSRRGFTLTIALVAVLTLVYIYSDQLMAAIPQTESFLSTYVEMIDTWRGWLDTRVMAMLTWLDEAAVSSSQ